MLASTDFQGSENDWRELDLLLRAFQISRMLRLVADLGIADRVATERAVTISQLAQGCAVLPDQLIRVLRALAAFRIFQISGDSVVSHTSRSHLLRTDAPNSLHHCARFWAAPGAWKAWGMLDAAMTGGTPYESAWNMSRFAYLRQHPEEARAFDTMMATFPDNRHEAIAGHYDFSRARMIADIGGGNGATLRQILARLPDARGILLDREDVIAALTAGDLMHGRITGEGGSFFDTIPAGADVYILVRVLHDWKDEDCLRILSCCHTAMDADAVLLLGEDILDPDPIRGNANTYLVDMQMMAMFGHARERTRAELHDLLNAAGFILQRVIPTGSAVSIIEATPAKT
jgi:hypothetical protein